MPRPNRSTLLLLSLLVFTAAAGPAHAADGTWFTLDPDGEAYSVEMPLQPKKEVKKTSTFAGTVEDTSYRARHDGEVYIATQVDLPWMASLMPDSTLLDNIRDSFLENSRGEEKSYADTERDGYTGKTLEFTMNKVGEAPRDARAIFFIVDGKMLSFTGIVPKGSEMSDVDRFLASAHLD